MLCRAVLVRDLVLLLLSGLLLLLGRVLTMELGNAGTKADTANNVEAAVRSRARVRGCCMAGWLDWTRCRYARGTRGDDYLLGVADQSDCSDSSIWVTRRLVAV